VDEALSRMEETAPARACERQLRRIGRRLQAVGQLLDQNPRKLITPDCENAPTGSRSRALLLDVTELRGFFDPSNPDGVSQLLCRYHTLTAAVSGADPSGDRGAGERPT
jgi:hypothetical protein